MVASEPARPAQRCAACGAPRLVLHMRVAGEAGPEGLAPGTLRFGVALADVARCAACGHMQLAPMPGHEMLERAYEEAESGDYLNEEAGQRATARAALDRIERHVAPERLLDAGCWVGFLLDEARRRGWQVVGVEPSEFAVRHARERLGLDVRQAALFDAGLEPRGFDALVLADVIEHLPDPGAALDQLAALARPGAVLALMLPDAGSRMARLLGRRWWSVIPTHVHLFTRRSLTVLLERHGWQVLELGTAPKAFTVRYYLGRIGGYAPWLSRLLVATAERAGVAGRVWAPDFGDRMAVIARAPGPPAGRPATMGPSHS